MKVWDETDEKVTKITPDREKARALLKVIQLREKNLKTMERNEMATLVVESYYEIIKECITGIMSADGYKTTSHELLIAYLAQFYDIFSSSELITMDQLRKIRNDIAYRGVLVKPEYIERNEDVIKTIIAKLKATVETKL